MMLMGYWSCAVQPGTAMTAHGDDEVRRHKGCRTFLLRPRAPRPSDPELPHAEANLPTRYPTHRKQRGGDNHPSAKILKKLGFEFIEYVLYKPTGLMHPSYVFRGPTHRPN